MRRRTSTKASRRTSSTCRIASRFTKATCSIRRRSYGCWIGCVPTSSTTSPLRASCPSVGWEQPIFTAEATGLGVTRLLDAVRHIDPRIRFYHGSSSEMFGQVRETPRRETTPFPCAAPTARPRRMAITSRSTTARATTCSPARASCGRRRSPRRGLEFVTRKISHGAARIKAGLDDQLRLGNLDAMANWGHARDYVRAMWLMLQQDEPDDYVVGTGEMHTVRKFVEIAFDRLGLNWKKHVVIDPAFYRPAEVEQLLADSTKAHALLGWKPEVSFEEFVCEMVDSDLARIPQEAPRPACIAKRRHELLGMRLTVPPKRLFQRPIFPEPNLRPLRPHPFSSTQTYRNHSQPIVQRPRCRFEGGQYAI